MSRISCHRKEDTLARQFKEKGLSWPARFVYIRSFKYDSQLEVWVKNSQQDKYKLFKSSIKYARWRVPSGPSAQAVIIRCRKGFTTLMNLTPRASTHLSLRLNYPNASDRILSDYFAARGRYLYPWQLRDHRLYPHYRQPDRGTIYYLCARQGHGRGLYPGSYLPCQF